MRGSVVKPICKNTQPGQGAGKTRVLAQAGCGEGGAWLTWPLWPSHQATWLLTTTWTVP